MAGELVERLKPSYAADKAAIEAAVQLRDKYPRLTESLNAAIVANNALKSEAVTEITRLTHLVQTLIDNDPDEPIADSGETVIDLWRHNARAALRSQP